MDIIKTEGIVKDYILGKVKVRALNGINLQIQKGEFVAIMGPSGSGKSTLMHILGCLDRPTDGEYYLDDILVSKIHKSALATVRNRKIGFVFQSFNLISFKTALENVALPLYYKGIRRSKRNKIAMEYLERMGLGEWADHMPSELSGGQKQRISIARALVANPRVILADEPTGALDSQTSVEVMQLLQQVNREGMTIVMVTHNPEMAAMSQKIINIRDGIIGSVEHNNKTGHV